MKFSKFFVVSFIVLVICTVASMNDFIFSEELKRMPASKIERTVWNPIIANDVNAQGIKLCIDNKAIEDIYIYMNDDGEIMFPSRLMTDELDCGVRTYKENEEFVVQRNTTLVTWNFVDDYITVATKEKNKEVKPGVDAEVYKGELYLPLEFLVEGLECRYIWMPENNTINILDLFTGEAYPEAFTYQGMPKMPVVKDQGSLGTCWAFAALSALESTLLPEELYEFSVDHMTINNGFSGTQNDGGEYTMALAYLAAWQGPVLEADDPYGDEMSPKGLKPVKHLQEAQIIAAKDFNAIKEMVFKYGAVQTSMYTSLTSSKDKSEYYNAETGAYCYIGTEKPNHDVAIVGWDDNYSRENFNAELEADGAFICLNSWGEEFGDGGVFYVSYYDTNIGVHNVVYTGVEAPDNYDNIYQADLCGWVGQLGYMKDTAYFANVYTAAADEVLEAVSFYATGQNTEYEVFFVEDFKDKNSFSDKISVASGKFENAGYYTVKLDKEIPLADGKKFAVAVKIKTPGAERPIAVEYIVDKSTQNVDLSDGEGYISLQGVVWENTETMQSCNVCLKVFTNNEKVGNDE